MKRNILTLMAMLGLGVMMAQSQTVLLNSWENTTEGWSILETGTWTSDGFSTSNGVTQGSYSWELTSSGVDWNPTLRGPLSTNLTLLMANASSVSMDIQLSTNAPAFGWGFQIDVEVVQPGGAGTVSATGYNYPGIYGNYSQTTVTWTVSQALRTALDAYPNLPCYLTLSIGGGGGGTIYIDNLRVNEMPVVQGALWVRELWDDLPGEEVPANTTVYDDTSSVGFSAADPWLVNPADTADCQLMAFRPGFPNDPLVGQQTMGLPGTLDGTYGCLVQDNAHGTTSWTDGDFMTRLLTPDNYINFQANGSYWFSMVIANSPTSLDGQYVNNPATGAGGLGFADGDTTNSDFVAIGATGLNILGPDGATDASKALYISQGTLGQPGNSASGTVDQTNFIGGPYYIRALGAQTVSHVEGDYIVLLAHLTTSTNGDATVDAKYYGVGVGGNPWNTDLDTNSSNITWDCSYSFNFKGTMTRLLLFQNGQFPFYIFGVRAGTNFDNVVGLDPGRINVAPLTDTYVGYPINMTNLAIEANSYSFATPPAGYGTLNYQWYKDGSPIGGATSQSYNIASASLGDAGTYTSVATDPSGTWGSVTDSVTVSVTQLADPQVVSIQMFHDQHSLVITYNEPNLTGIGSPNVYIFTGGIAATNVTVINTGTASKAYVTTTTLPLGTKVTLSINGVTNVVGGTLAATNLTFWTDLVQTGAANFDAFLYPALVSQNDYFNNFVPANPNPPILTNQALTSWEGPSSGINIVGTDGYTGDGFGSKLYGWFVPPVTTNYVFYISCDDGGRLSLSTDDSPANLRAIACESLWNGPDEWTNICDQYPGPGSPHRGDGTATAAIGTTGYVWDNSVAGQSPATACIQNRSDQFIVAFWDSSQITGAAGEPPGATDQANWAAAPSQVTDCVPLSMTNNFWPNVDANGQALIHLQAGHMYYMELESMQVGGGYNEGVTYKVAGEPDPASGIPGSSTNAAPSALTGSVIAGTVPFTPTLSIANSNGVPVITYTGVLLAGTSVNSITNVVAQSSAATAISLGGPSQYTPPTTNSAVFYRTSE